MTLLHRQVRALSPKRRAFEVVGAGTELKDESGDWPAELLVWRARDRATLLLELERLAQALDEEDEGDALPDLARALTSSAGVASSGSPTLAIVACSLADLRDKLRQARSTLAAGRCTLQDRRGITYAERVESPGRVAFLFPGQGAQRPEMLRALGRVFPEVKRGFESFDAALVALGRAPVGPLVFPVDALEGRDRELQKAALAATEVAQPALGAACVGALGLFEALGIVPDMVAGHSFGEVVALHAAGAFTLDALAELAEARGRFLRAAGRVEPGAMAALGAGPELAEALLDGLDGVNAAQWNGPTQTVISGTRAAVFEARARALRRGVRVQLLPIGRAFHSPLVAGAEGPLAALAGRLDWRAPARPVYSNVTAAPYPVERAAAAAQLGAHVTRPVRFAAMIEAMHDDGARVFIEVGPGGGLSALVGSILAGRPHLAVACDPQGMPGVPGLLHALARLVVAGVPVRLDRLHEGRTGRALDSSVTGGMGSGRRDRPRSDGRSRPLGASSRTIREARRFAREALEIDLPRPMRPAGLAAGGRLVVTDDGRGIARALAFDLRAKGFPVVRVVHGGEASEGEIDGADLTDPGSVAACLDRIRGWGPIVGLVHALPLRAGCEAGLDRRAWADRLGPELRGLVLLAEAVAPDLHAAAEQGGACLLAATALGGGSALAGRVPGAFFPGQGAIAGFVRATAGTWPEAVRVRAVDLDPDDPTEVIATHLAQEVQADDGRTSVGYLERRRITLVPAAHCPLPGVAFAEGDPIVVMGRVRGFAAALARRDRARLLRIDSARADRRDPDAVRRVVDGWRARFGPIRGLIVGAGSGRTRSRHEAGGVLPDRVADALNLAAALDPESLRFAAIRTSGAPAQAAADEALVALAAWLDRRWPCPVVALEPGW